MDIYVSISKKVVELSICKINLKLISKLERLLSFLKYL